MSKNGFAQINGVAVTAFVACHRRRGVAQRNDASACTRNHCWVC